MKNLLIFILSLTFFTNNFCQEVILEPIELICPGRFDVMAKYIYAKHYDMGITRGWPLEVYREHLRVWNNFHENLPAPDFPHFGCAKEYIKKDSFFDFVENFNFLLDSFKKEGFNTEKSILPISKSKFMIDGSHRLAASLVYDELILGKVFNHNSKSYFDAQFFKSLGLEQNYLDAMALEYAQLKQNTYIAILFPSVNFDLAIKKIKKIFSHYSKVVYEKSVKLYQHGPLNLITLLYEGESWVGTVENNFAGAPGKMRACFPKCGGTIDVFLIEAESIDKVRKAKNEIRKLFNVENHSMHINDTHEETIKIAQTLFLENGIHWLNYAKKSNLLKFQRYLQKYKDWIKKNDIKSELLCVDSGGVLAAYGLRDCSDLDFISYYDCVNNDPEINSHKDEMKYHKYTKEQIILDPQYHFYYEGLKIASLEVVKAMKSKRNEVKDREDLKLIDYFLYRIFDK